MCCVFLLWPVLTTRIISVRSKNHLILKLGHVGPDWAYPCHRSTRTTEYNRYHRVSPGQSWSVPSWHWGRWELGSPGHRTEMDYEWSGFGFAIAPCSSFVGPCWFNLLIYAGPFWTEDLEDTKESTIYDNYGYRHAVMPHTTWNVRRFCSTGWLKLLRGWQVKSPTRDLADLGLL